MRYFRTFLNALLLLLVTPGLSIQTRAEISAPIESFEEEFDAYAQIRQGLPITYDGFLKLLHDLENDELEKKYDLDDLHQINQFLISCARQGLLPSDDAEELEADIDELLSDDTSSEFSFWADHTYSIAPTTLHGPIQIMLCKSFGSKAWRETKKAWKDTKKWAKKHKKTLITLAAIATGAAIALGTAAATKPDAASDSKESEDPKPIPFPSNARSNEHPLIALTLEEELLSFKELVDREEFLNPKNTRFPLEEDGRILRDAFMHQSLDVFQKRAASDPEFHRELQELGRSNHPRSSETIFSMDGFTYSVPKPSKGSDGNVYQLLDGNLYQMRGEYALELHDYDQAIRDFSKVIEENPNHPDAYLDRATAHLNSGDYERSLADYQSYTVQKPAPLKYAFDFSTGFAKGLPKGALESGLQLGPFARDVIIHPINTATEVAQALTSLSKLVYSQEWEILVETLVPEVCELAAKWDTLSPKDQGEHAGYVFGKYGADILIPGASAKILSKGVKGAKKLGKACKSLKTAEKTLALEVLVESVELEKRTSIGKSIQAAQKSTTLAEELTYTTQEVQQLKQAERLENVANNVFENSTVKPPSEAYLIAKNGGKHSPLISQYIGKTSKEIQKGIKSYEKQIAIHQEKIRDPSAHIPGWDKLDPRRQDALINRRWPAEIQCYTEQRDVLQSILDQRG